MTETSTSRADLLGGLEQEVGVMIRRIRRVIGERARAVHPELQSSSYLMLTWLTQHGAQRSSAMVESLGIDKGAISRQVQHLLDLGLVDRTPDPDDGRATLISISAAAAERITEVKHDRRRWLDERLGDWPDQDLSEFVRMLASYNAALDA
ncbi:MarR family winged helix-turn-helix transcriptional regulator [Nocardioides sp. URHA0020]|uniref:MarR family winged helix-turn-helix transcriptional regulator n=1 Tax=Nocardioides sp. URHA0020 TaxID=1380392 RepID=UPI0006882B4A|nr:MarR family transcriptional regulator [Nocardioides sp. URHA0020]